MTRGRGPPLTQQIGGEKGGGTGCTLRPPPDTTIAQGRGSGRWFLGNGRRLISLACGSSHIAQVRGLRVTVAAMFKARAISLGGGVLTVPS